MPTVRAGFATAVTRSPDIWLSASFRELSAALRHIEGWFPKGGRPVPSAPYSPFRESEGRPSFASRRPDSEAKSWVTFARRSFLPPNSPPPQGYMLLETPIRWSILLSFNDERVGYRPPLICGDALRCGSLLPPISTTSWWDSHAAQCLPCSRPSRGEASSQRYRLQT